VNVLFTSSQITRARACKCREKQATVTATSATVSALTMCTVRVSLLCRTPDRVLPNWWTCALFSPPPRTTLTPRPPRTCSWRNDSNASTSSATSILVRLARWGGIFWARERVQDSSSNVVSSCRSASPAVNAHSKFSLCNHFGACASNLSPFSTFKSAHSRSAHPREESCSPNPPPCADPRRPRLRTQREPLRCRARCTATK
jgi:hypothetical protein